LQLSLGGFVDSGAVVLWSVLCPFGALLFDEPKRAPRWFLAFLALVFVSGAGDPFLRPDNNLSEAVVRIFFVANVGAVSGLAFALLYSFIREKNRALELLRLEQEKSDSLLLNILPEEIAAILKNESRTIADHFEGASILFADMVDFTPKTASMEPVEMVELLNAVFSHFDLLVERYRLEKIRTIGDSYMVAAGVPRPRPDHAHALARMALDIREYLQSDPACVERGIDFRIGINSGPVVAGVIGRKKFIYDLWGDAVNTASRMESHGEAGRIHISSATYELIKGDFHCDPRGAVQVKGKGEMQTWYLAGVRPEKGETVT
jgi:guanylate cyclase